MICTQKKGRSYRDDEFAWRALVVNQFPTESKIFNTRVKVSLIENSMLNSSKYVWNVFVCLCVCVLYEALMEFKSKICLFIRVCSSLLNIRQRDSKNIISITKTQLIFAIACCLFIVLASYTEKKNPR